MGQALRIGVSRSAVAVLRSSRWSGDRLSRLAEQDVLASSAGAEDAYAALGQALDAVLRTTAGAGHAGWPVSFVLDDDLLRLWQVALPSGASKPQDLAAAAAMRFQALYGESPAAWSINAGWAAGAPFFGAMPRALLAQIERVAAAHKLHIVAIVPHFAAAWNRWQGSLAGGAWYGLMHDGVLTVAAVEAGVLRAVRPLPVPHGAEHYWLNQTLRREALLLDLAAPSKLMLSGPAPLSWSKPSSTAGDLPVALLEPAALGADWPASARLARAGSTT
ncbi:hypothetical protein GJA_3970 [Janthinobacterium agaricidamnosum NBRC 102515 = DSM 9628]|uniref:Uncharacterized protein n=1 Tax=Janthinobacterium agaricidamnosum NBRC 102515 = DSM 9628 TaxID=1349767 RepID=W0V9L2_9BURK|nr:hypothetical protein GJA_3970 [Janthinobacterium agaricidamnosum NBRC 102515 = DSM 9628]